MIGIPGNGDLHATRGVCRHDGRAHRTSAGPRKDSLVVGQCYATCMDKASKSAATTQEKSTRLTELLISDDFFQLTDDSQDEFIRALPA